METSILKSVKKALNLVPEAGEFDLDITMFINAVFVTLNDLGVGPTAGYQILGDDETWDDYIPDDLRVNSIKIYIYLSVRMLFDPPKESWVLTAMENQITELAWRINVRRETTDYFRELPDTDVAIPVDKRVVPNTVGPGGVEQ